MKTYTLQINRHGNMIVAGDEIARNTYRIIETSTDYWDLYEKKHHAPKRKKAISYMPTPKPATPKPTPKPTPMPVVQEVDDNPYTKMGVDSYVPAPKAAPKPKPTKKGLTKQQLQAIKEIEEQVLLISRNHERIYQIAQQTIDSIKASA